METQTQQKEEKMPAPLAKIFEEDPMLNDFEHVFKKIYEMEKKMVDQINFGFEGGIEEFSRAYEYYGITEDDEYYYIREWLPGAESVHLVGDFNFWNREELPLEKDKYGTFSIKLDKTEKVIKQGSSVKLFIRTNHGPDREYDRNMAYAHYAVQDKTNNAYIQKYFKVNKLTETKKAQPKFNKDDQLIIYESHVGMSSQEPKISSYREFADRIIPHIKKQGYNTVQIMALQEHAYYASFGYQVTNFFACSSRFGTPEDLQYLIEKAHEHGLRVIVDLVLSHASSNSLDGIGNMDGTGYQYFHEGDKGTHQIWGSKLFNYSKFEVLRFLLSSVRWWIEMFDIDGFRLDAITSMLYTHHGTFVGFSGDYREYFSDGVLDLVRFFDQFF